LCAVSNRPSPRPSHEEPTARMELVARLKEGAAVTIAASANTVATTREYMLNAGPGETNDELATTTL